MNTMTSFTVINNNVWLNESQISLFFLMKMQQMSECQIEDMNEHSETFSVMWEDHARNLIIEAYYSQSVLLTILLLMYIRNHIIIQDSENLFVFVFFQNAFSDTVF